MNPQDIKLRYLLENPNHELEVKVFTLTNIEAGALETLKKKGWSFVFRGITTFQHDEDGQEIFSGDIIDDHHGWRGQVHWDQDKGGFMVNFKKGKRMSATPFTKDLFTHAIKVVGNIWDQEGK